MFAALLLLAYAAQAGHWEGRIKLPERDVLFSVNLSDRPDWNGTWTIPTGDAPPLALATIEVSPPTIEFAVPELPGAPVFKGMLDADRTSIAGVVTSSSQTRAFEMRRTGDVVSSSIEARPVNTALDVAFCGNWKGVLTIGGQTTHLLLHLQNEADGFSSGTLDADGPQLTNFLLSGVAQTGASHLRFEAKLIGGVFEGELMSSGSIAGKWTQEKRSADLVWKRVR